MVTAAPTGSATNETTETTETTETMALRERPSRF